MKLDILAFSPHPDDVELCIGGMLAKMTSLGYKIGVIDLTQGEMGSYGDASQRLKEAQNSSMILGLKTRETLDFGDSRIENNNRNRIEIAKIIRKYQPSVMLLPYWKDKHLDHIVSSHLIEGSCLEARLKKLDLGFEIWKPKKLFYYPMHYYVQPTLVVDITKFRQIKIEAINAYKSQFSINKKDFSELIRPKNFIFHIESRDRFYGSLINADYGEGLISKEPLAIEDIMHLIK